MEKIIFSNLEELKINAISRVENLLNIRFLNGDMQTLEETFLNQDNLEKIILVDEMNNPMAVFANFTSLITISKEKNIIINEVTDEKSDVVIVTLKQESKWSIENRKLREQLAVYDGAITDLGTVVSSIAEGGH